MLEMPLRPQMTTRRVSAGGGLFVIPLANQLREIIARAAHVGVLASKNRTLVWENRGGCTRLPITDSDTIGGGRRTRATRMVTER